MIRLNDKRGIDLMSATIIFILINVAFFGIMFFTIERIGNNAALHEQLNAKEIALLIDGSKPGTVIEFDLGESEKFIKRYGLSLGQVVKIGNGEVGVRLTRNGNGYSYKYFSDYEIEYSLFSDIDGNSILNMRISENE